MTTHSDSKGLGLSDFAKDTPEGVSARGRQANRSTETLTKFIQHHVDPGATIYTDGWVGYTNLNSIVLLATNISVSFTPKGSRKTTRMLPLEKLYQLIQTTSKEVGNVPKLISAKFMEPTLTTLKLICVRLCGESFTVALLGRFIQHSVSGQKIDKITIFLLYFFENLQNYYFSYLFIEN